MRANAWVSWCPGPAAKVPLGNCQAATGRKPWQEARTSACSDTHANFAMLFRELLLMILQHAAAAAAPAAAVHATWQHNKGTLGPSQQLNIPTNHHSEALPDHFGCVLQAVGASQACCLCTVPFLSQTINICHGLLQQTLTAAGCASSKSHPR
jgi:hypothetical protein